MGRGNAGQLVTVIYGASYDIFYCGGLRLYAYSSHGYEAR
jgi:hypothetical protein